MFASQVGLRLLYKHMPTPLLTKTRIFWSLQSLASHRSQFFFWWSQLLWRTISSNMQTTYFALIFFLLSVWFSSVWSKVTFLFLSSWTKVLIYIQQFSASEQSMGRALWRQASFCSYFILKFMHPSSKVKQYLCHAVKRRAFQKQEHIWAVM